MYNTPLMFSTSSNPLPTITPIVSSFKIENIKSIEFNEETSCDKHACMALDMVKDAIDTLEVKEVDLEKGWKEFLKDGDVGFKEIAKHFFELGLKAQKGE